MYSEAVRPQKLLSFLQFLQENNHLYENTSISMNNLGSESDDRASMHFIDDDDIDMIVERNINNEQLSEFNSDSVEIRFIDDEKVKIIKPFESDIDEFSNEDPLSTFRSAAVETVLISEVPHLLLDKENAVIAPGEGKVPLSVIDDEYCEELAHPHLFPTGKFGYNVKRDIHLTPTKYFNQRLLNYSQKFAQDPQYIFYANFVVQQLNLRSQMGIAMRKVCGNNITAGMIRENFETTVKSFIANDEAYRFMRTVKGTPAYWRIMLSDVLAMVKQLGLPSYFLTLSCADLRWNELIMIISRMNGIDITEEEVENLSYTD